MVEEVKLPGARSAHAIATLRAAGNRRPIIVPVLFIENADGRVRVAKEALAYTLQMIEGGKPLPSARAVCKTLGRVADLYRYVRDSEVATEEDLVDIVYLYADYRLNGSKRADGTDPSGLDWSPISWRSFVGELTHIADYSTHCAVQYGYAPLVPRSKPALSNGGSALRRLEAFKKPEKRGFFSHLSARREAWARLRPQEQRPVVRHAAIPRKGIDKEVVSEEFIRALIDAESNPYYRMLWILGAFGGPRLSEQLNLWVCDVRLPEARRTMFRDDSGGSTPLVVLANPRLSRWIGKHSWDKQDRTALLREQYGLTPRPDCDNQAQGPYGLKVARAGWKGMLVENDTFQASQVYWIDPAMGHEYLKLASQLLEFHRRHDIGKRHPWLMINTDERKPEVLGRPMTMPTVNKAWERACERVGFTPYRAGRHKHGLRDFYKEYAQKVLGLSPVEIRIMMHHIDIESQEDYGKVDGRSVSDVLNAAVAARQQTLLPSFGS